MRKQCYMCSNEATSVEHAPPKCFFPDGYRTNLLTVPSCDEHNLHTSKDDQYVRNLLAMAAGLNQIGRDLVSPRARRSLTESPGLRKITFSNVIPVTQNGENGLAIEWDKKRVEVVMRKIVCALHYRHTGSRFMLPVEILLREAVRPPNDMKNVDRLFSLTESQGLTWHGENPSIFRYHWIQLNQSFSNFVLNFYEGVTLIAAPNMTGIMDPNDLL